MKSTWQNFIDRHLVSLRGVVGILVVLNLALNGVSATAAAQYTSDSRSIAWLPVCPEFGLPVPDELLSRTQCGIVTAPLDHLDQSKGSTTFGIILVHAKKEREGAIFANPGGPGLPAGMFTLAIADMWDKYNPVAPGGTAYQKLSEHYDLIGISPRGTGGFGAEHLTCSSAEIIHPENDITDDRSEKNVKAIRENAATVARGCLAQERVPYFNTDQTVRDFELVRSELLGAEEFNYFGVSYGTWLGAWYGSLFPERVGRMVLDSNMNWISTFTVNSLSQPPSRDAIFDHFVADYAAARPEVYGMGSNAKSIRQSFIDLSPIFRPMVRPSFNTPEVLMSARIVDGWLKENPKLSEEELQRLVDQYTFSHDQIVNETAKFWARSHSENFFLPPPPPYDIKPGPLYVNYATSIAVECNDTVGSDGAFWTAKENEYARKFPIGGSNMYARYCADWVVQRPVRPSVEQLAKVPSLMMVQAEFDPATPAVGAYEAFAKVKNANMIFLEGVSVHGVSTYGLYPCINQYVASYLAYGIKPHKREIVCPKPDEKRENKYIMYREPEKIKKIVEFLQDAEKNPQKYYLN
jgi:pimeloyl-ACP methyl ester carboxylesterase